MKNLIIEKINVAEAVRYMGYGSNEPDEKIKVLIDKCEKNLLTHINPCFVYKVFDIQILDGQVNVSGTSLVLKGNDICEHLADCEKCVLLAATLSAGADKVIRLCQTQDMTEAVITDCLASAAIEQVCDYAEGVIRQEFPEYFQTWRFSPGYGDFPLDIQGDFLCVLDAPKRIGLNALENNILVPRKSVTAVIGLSENEITKKRRGCAACNMNKVCQFRKRGEHCGF